MRARAHRIILALSALALCLAGCQPTKNPTIPWDLEGKAIPPVKIVSAEIEPEPPTMLMVEAIVAPDISREDLTTISQHIIEQQPKHRLALIFYYASEDEVGEPYTVGKAWWGIGDGDHFPPDGDYTYHTLKVDLASEAPTK